MEHVARWVRHNQGVFVSMIICAGLLVWGLGCKSKVASLVDPTKRVTSPELAAELDQLTARLNAELDALIKMAELRQQDLLRQDEVKTKLFEFAAMTYKAGTFNPAGVITLVGSLLGVGLVVDNRIKDKVIKNRPLAES